MRKRFQKLTATCLLVMAAFFNTTAATAQTATLGIGLIIDNADYDRISHDVYQFFMDNPIMVNGTPLKVQLVDDPYQTDFAITGSFKHYHTGCCPDSTKTNQADHCNTFETDMAFKIWKNKRLVQELKDTTYFDDRKTGIHKTITERDLCTYFLGYKPIVGNSNCQGFWAVDKRLMDIKQGLIDLHTAILELTGGTTAKSKKGSVAYNFSNITFEKFTGVELMELGNDGHKVGLLGLAKYKSKYKNTSISSVIPGYNCITWPNYSLPKDQWLKRFPSKTPEKELKDPSLSDLEEFYTLNYRFLKSQEFYFAEFTGLDRNLPEDFVYSVSSMFFPKFSNPGAPLFLEYIANQKEALQDKTAAAHYFWSALLLTNNLNASAAVKVDIRKKCLAGLASVAAQRQQTFYSSLLELDAKLSENYLASPNAKTADSIYYTAMEEVHKQLAVADEQVQNRIDYEAYKKALRKAENAKFFFNLGLQTAIGAGTVATSGTFDQKSFDRSFKKDEYQDALVQKQLEKLDQQVTTSMYASLAGKKQNTELLEQLKKDVNEIELSKTFLGQDIQFFMLANEQYTLRMLTEFSSDKPTLKKLLKAYVAAGKNEKAKNEALLHIVEKIRDYEVACRMYECKGNKIPQEFEL
ncbi:hypothetical protein [Flavisolibacter tropicus]|uniref:Uncharacterized protein n=1 Tax=Flavisolibacter tropicus TaxID=1492898 RepID=A0A172TZM6_9BACT|nr:hypothetical protein [Flavisolibacter tropicus]ANE52324.1 hypothetical protein SY85_19365 [Flavisolibacter tropicus]